MLSGGARTPTFRPQKDESLDWPSFNGGWNSFSKPTELRPNELNQADNLMLSGVGTPTGRWGSLTYMTVGTGRTRLLDAYYNSTASANYLLTINDTGLLYKKSGASGTLITGASFASGSVYQSTQLGGNTYIAASPKPFIKFDGTNLIPYVALSTPTNVSVAMLSSASGYSTWSWIVTANTRTGQTLPSLAKTLASLPLDLTKTSIKVSWNAVSSAPSILTGYTVYRGTPGNETFLASVDSSSTSFIDVGDPASATIFPPATDSTAGSVAKYIIRLDDRLVLAGFQNDPSRVEITARYPYHESTSAIDGGAYCYVSPNDGDEIMGLGITHIQTTTPLIVVYKKYSTHIITLSSITLGNYSILNPIPVLLSASSGVSSGDTVVPVENDTYSFGRKGLYSTGQEAQYLNQIRSNELSARIRPYIQNLTDADFREACAAYIDYKYILSFPSKKETIIFDRQRMAFMGPWKTPFGITKWFKYYDESGNEVWLAGCDDGVVREFSSSFISDDGTTIVKTLRTKKESMGDWNMMKMLKYFYFLFRNVRGQVTINLRIEGRDGNTITTKTTTISSELAGSGWGNDQYGDQMFGDTDATVSISGDELARYSIIYKQFRVLQVEVVADQPNSNFEFLGVRATAVGLGSQSLPSKLKI